MSLFEQVATIARPQQTERIKMYSFAKESVPLTREQLEETEIETVLATSFDDCFRQRPELSTWFIVSIVS